MWALSIILCEMGITLSFLLPSQLPFASFSQESHLLCSFGESVAAKISDYMSVLGLFLLLWGLGFSQLLRLNDSLGSELPPS
jgi:hypothetical protein